MPGKGDKPSGMSGKRSAAAKKTAVKKTAKKTAAKKTAKKTAKKR
jgi:hypothetical protein